MEIREERVKKQKWGFIVNPKAGDGKALKVIGVIEDIAKVRFIDYDIRYTNAKGHASIIASSYTLEGFTHIISVGGDGTHNEAIQNIIGKDIVFGVVSAGSGNDIPPILGFPESFDSEAWDALFEAKTVNIDVGRCNDRYFLNAIGAGYDAYVAHDMERLSNKGKRNKMHYFTSVFKNVLFFKPCFLTYTYNDRKERVNSILASIGIGRHIGGGFHLTPCAIANDDNFDVCIIEFIPAYKRAVVLLKVLCKKHKDINYVKYFNTKRIILNFDSEIACHVDGEIFFDNYLDVKIVADKLSIIYNPNRYNYFDTKYIVE